MPEGPPQEGWWMASDGNWYPPETHPAVNAPGAGAPGTPAPTPAPQRGANRGCLIALAALAVLGLLAIGGVVVALVVADDVVDEVVDEATGGSGTGDLPGLFGGDCARFQAAFLTLTMSGFLGAGADEAQQEQLDESLAELRDLAPAEVADDVEVVAGAVREAMALAFAQGAIPFGADPDEAEEASRRVSEILESPEVAEAEERIDRWVTANC